MRRGLLDRTRKNAALETRNAKGAARKRRNYVATEKDTLRGHTRVEIAEIAQPTSTSLTMNLDAEAEAAEAELMIVEDGPRQKRRGGTRGEIALETLVLCQSAGAQTKKRE